MLFEGLIPHPYAAEIALLDRAAERLSHPSKWCQRQLHSADGKRSCLIGAFEDRGSIPYGNIIGQFAELIRILYPNEGEDSNSNIVLWNDARERTHAQVLALIDAAREAFEEKR